MAEPKKKSATKKAPPTKARVKAATASKPKETKGEKPIAKAKADAAALPPASSVEASSLVGKPAPALDLEGPEGKSFALSDFAGKKLVLYFYPKDDTPGCTLEALDFHAARAAFARKNAVVVGVSRDSAASHARFCKKHDLALTLLSDPSARVLSAYGVWAEKVLYGNRSVGIVRSTFVIDEQGVVRAAFPKVKVAGHVDAVLASL
jgi:peroxiredoxin Q/BCP